MRCVATTALTVIVTAPALADTVFLEDFEDATIGYTVSTADDLSDIAARDYFGRIAPDTSTPPVDVAYTNPQGSGYYGVQDTDSTPVGDIDLITLDVTGINISTFENLSLSWYVGEDAANDGNQDWDLSSSFRIAVQIDGGGFNTIFAIESEVGTDGNETTELPRVDTDFDGTGDGAAITDVMTQFSSAIANGTTLDIRVTIEDLDSGDEDIAFDNLLLTGDVVPEPASAALLLGGMTLMLRRRRA